MPFAVIWCTMTGLFSAVFLYAVLFGEASDKGPGEPLAPWLAGVFLILFFGAFWAVGLGMLYVAVRNKWSRTQVVVDLEKVTMTRELFGRVSASSLPRSEVTAVALVVFHESNDVPVYGVEIRAGKRKLKFGSMLRDDEKGWLEAELKREILGEPAPPVTQGGFPDAGTLPQPQRRDFFSLVIPTARKHLWPLAVVLSLMGIAFFLIGIFLLDDMGFEGSDRDAPGFVRAFDFIFSLLSGGFRIFWLLISGAMAVGGIAMTTHLARNRGVENRLEATAAEVAIRKVRQGRILKEEVHPRSQVRDLRTSESGSSNGKPMKRITLWVGQREITLAKWVDGEAADSFADEARRALF